MSIKVKRDGVYADALGVYVKRSGAYAVLAGLSVKSGGIYSSAYSSVSADADVAAWQVRLTALGGSITYSERVAAEALVASAKANDFWRFRRLDLMCGDFIALSAPLVNTSGSAANTLVNFVSSDYNRSLGLQTDGSSKYLNTGYIPSEATGGMSAYLRTLQGASATTREVMGALNSGATQNFRMAENTASTLTTPTSGSRAVSWGGSTGTGAAAAASGAGTTVGLIHSSRTAATSLTQFFNGASVATSATSRTPATAGVPITIFGVNLQGTGTVNYLIAGSRISAYAMDTGMTDTQAAAYYAAMQAFQTTLGRNV